MVLVPVYSQAAETYPPLVTRYQSSRVPLGPRTMSPVVQHVSQYATFGVKAVPNSRLGEDGRVQTPGLRPWCASARPTPH